MSTQNQFEKKTPCYKWIGGVTGYLCFGVLGAFAGIALAGFLEQINLTSKKDGIVAEMNKKSDILEGQRNGFLFSVLLLISYIIEADGLILSAETGYIHSFFTKYFGEEASKEADDILKRLLEKKKDLGSAEWKENIAAACKQIGEFLTEQQCHLLVAFLINLTKADDEVSDEEIVALREVSGWLGLDTVQIEHLEQQEDKMAAIYENVFEMDDMI